MAARTPAAAASKSYWREADARQVVEAWRRSGQPLSRFAAAQGLKAARLGSSACRVTVRHRRRLKCVANHFTLRITHMRLIRQLPRELRLEYVQVIAFKSTFLKSHGENRS